MITIKEVCKSCLLVTAILLAMIIAIVAWDNRGRTLETLVMLSQSVGAYAGEGTQEE
jgi:hypothetical protein